VPAQLLTETLPLSGSSSLLAAPIVLTWLCSALTAELLGRPSRPSVLGMAVPVFYFALAYVATSSGPAGRTMPEGAACSVRSWCGALARQSLVEAGAVRAGPVGAPPAKSQPGAAAPYGEARQGRPWRPSCWWR